MIKNMKFRWILTSRNIYMLFLYLFRNLIQYRIKMGTNQSSDEFGVVVMGSTKVGKTSFIRHLLQRNDSVKEPEQKIDNLFEYREYTQTADGNHNRSHEPTLRSRAINSGNMFVLLFSVNDIETFDFVSDLRASIVEKKGQDVPIIFVGLKPERSPGVELKRSISFEFADLVISFDLESKYMELSFCNEDELAAIHGEILGQQQGYYKQLLESGMRRRTSSFGRLIQRLQSIESPDVLGFLANLTNKLSVDDGA